MKKKTITLFLLLVILANIKAQETVGSAGQDLNNAQINTTFTIGEPVINTLSSNSNTILSGYHQPHLKIDAISIKEGKEWNISIYPNPATNYVNVDWDNKSINYLKYTLLDVNGKIILQGQNTENLRINVEAISSGNYFLHLNSNNKQSQIYKIQKTK